MIFDTNASAYAEMTRVFRFIIFDQHTQFAMDEVDACQSYDHCSLEDRLFDAWTSLIAVENAIKHSKTLSTREQCIIRKILHYAEKLRLRGVHVDNVECIE